MSFAKYSSAVPRIVGLVILLLLVVCSALVLKNFQLIRDNTNLFDNISKFSSEQSDINQGLDKICAEKQALIMMMKRSAAQVILLREELAEVEGGDFCSPSAVERGGVISVEWTSQMIIVFELLSEFYMQEQMIEKAEGYKEKADYYLGELEKQCARISVCAKRMLAYLMQAAAELIPVMAGILRVSVRFLPRGLTLQFLPKRSIIYFRSNDRKLFTKDGKIKVLILNAGVKFLKVTDFFRLYSQNKARIYLFFKKMSLLLFSEYREIPLNITCFIFIGLFLVSVLQPNILYAQNYSAQRYLGYTEEENEEEIVEEQEEEEKEIKDTVVKGSYRLNFGIKDDEFQWKDANYLLQEGSWRYFFGEQRHNTYDAAIYNNFKLSVDAHLNENLSFYTKIVVDPWSFVGKSKATIIPSWYGPSSTDDPVEIQLKYWSNSGRIYPQIVRSAEGDSFALPETKVKDGYSQPVSASTEWGGPGFYHRIDLPSLKIDREFKPMRALWFDLKEDEYRAIVFLYAEETISMWTDDPLFLVNNHIVWEPSPWLNMYQPGKLYNSTGWENGTWTLDSQLRDSESNWLTLLRAFRFEGEIASIYTDFMIAAPMDPWDDYDKINNIPLAVRFKKGITDWLMLGSIYTARWGYDMDSSDAFDQAMGIDSLVAINEYHNLKMEYAYSLTKRNLNEEIRETAEDDSAYKIVVESDVNPFDLEIKSDLSFSRMCREFQAPLSNYTYTRDDLGWGRHLSFYKRSKEEEMYRIGNGLDKDRQVIAWGVFFGGYDEVDAYFNYRNVRNATDNGLIENVFRNEFSYQYSDDLFYKFLALYHQRDETTDNKSQDTSTVSVGFQYDFCQWIRLEEIWERTNQYPDYPDRIYDWLTINPAPPYPYYYILSSRLIVAPREWVEISLENTYNEFEHATTLDDFMNYSGTTIRFWPNHRLSANVVYRYSNVADYIRNYKKIGHHNVYFDFTYDIFDDARLKLQFSDLGTYVEGIGWQSSVLDTHHIIRLIYEGKF